MRQKLCRKKIPDFFKSGINLIMLILIKIRLLQNYKNIHALCKNARVLQSYTQKTLHLFVINNF